MITAQDTPIPEGWAWGEWDARVTQLRGLPMRVQVLLAAEWASSVLHVFESQYPTDTRPRKAIEAAEAWAKKPSAADAARAARAAARWKWIYATYRAAAGPVGVEFSAAWRTETAVALAHGIVAGRAFDRMPILADAMEEAGCDLWAELNRLRDPGEVFTAADWCLWNLLGYGEGPG